MSAAIALSLSVAAGAVQGPALKVTTPEQEFGHAFGDDYFLATYRQLAAYWQKLDRESDRMVLQSIGKTSEGRDQWMAIVTSPENHRNLAKYRDISRRLALAEGLTDEQARALAREGKAIVWIDGGLHANEVLGAQQLGEMVYQMVSRTDAETMRILDDVIILFVHANPDGHDLVADWYMRNPVPAERSSAGLPRLYHKYIGHDNNRDFFGSTQLETENMNRVLYREWFPQILYNHHQSGPPGTVLWTPPLRDPFNYNQDPLLVLGIQTIGIALQTRLAAEGKPGATARSGGPYDGWWNGGLRNTAAFHNTIAILTEMIGTPTPMRVPLVLERQLPTSDLTFPVPPQEWHFRQSVDYSVTANRGVLDIASKMKENFLFNRFVMGRNSIERGSRDNWTAKPHRYAAAATEVSAGAAEAGAGAGRAPARLRLVLLGVDAAAGAAPSTKPRSGRRCTSRRIGIRARTSCRRARPTLPPPRSSSTRCSKPASACIGPPAIFPSKARATRAGPMWCSPTRRFGRTSSTCSRRRITRTTSRIRAPRRRVRTTTPAGRWRFRWGSNTTASSKPCRGRSK